MKASLATESAQLCVKLSPVRNIFPIVKIILSLVIIYNYLSFPVLLFLQSISIFITIPNTAQFSGIIVIPFINFQWFDILWINVKCLLFLNYVGSNCSFFGNFYPCRLWTLEGTLEFSHPPLHDFQPSIEFTFKYDFLLLMLYIQFGWLFFFHFRFLGYQTSVFSFSSFC